MSIADFLRPFKARHTDTTVQMSSFRKGKKNWKSPQAQEYEKAMNSAIQKSNNIGRGVGY